MILPNRHIYFEEILRVVWPNQQRHSTEAQWSVNQVNGQSHQVQLTKKEKDVPKNYDVYSTMKIRDTEALGPTRMIES